MQEKIFLKITGMGFYLPDKEENGVCDTKERFWQIVKNGECVLSRTPEYKQYGIGVAGKIHNWKYEELNIKEKHLKKYSTATIMGSLALKRAMEDAQYTNQDLSNDRTMLIVSSAMLTLENVGKQYKALYEDGPESVGFDFFIQGTPGSIACGISKVLELNCPITTLCGSCIITPHALQTAYEKLQLGIIDKAIVVGIDDQNEPLYFSSVTHHMKIGQTIASLSDNPLDIAPHDKKTRGNSCGQGAIAVILERESSTHKCSQNTDPFRLFYGNSRKNGHSMFDCGEPDNFATSIRRVLEEAEITIEQLGFINDFTEGADFIEDFFIDAVNRMRQLLQYNGALRLTNQEASFGHVGGITGLVKLVSNLMMMHYGIITPCVNCKEPNEALNASPVIGSSIESRTRYSLMMSCGAGGDCAITLIEKKAGDNEQV